MSPALAGGFFTTETLGKPSFDFIFKRVSTVQCKPVSSAEREAEEVWLEEEGWANSPALDTPLLLAPWTPSGGRGPLLRLCCLGVLGVLGRARGSLCEKLSR